MNPHQSARAASLGRTGRLSGRRVYRLEQRLSCSYSFRVKIYVKSAIQTVVALIPLSPKYSVKGC